MTVLSERPVEHGPAGGVEGAVWRFVLFVEPVPRAAQLRAIGHGATLLRETGIAAARVRLDWPAPVEAQALADGIHAVERAGLRVLRVDVDDWVTAADMAHRVDRCRETVRQWAVGQHGPGGFPPPANPRRDTTFYSWAEVLPWLRGQLGLDLPEEEPALVAANLAIQLRALLPRVARSRVLVDLLGKAARTEVN